MMCGDLSTATRMETITQQARPSQSKVGRETNGYLSFDMSGGPKGAKRPLERPLDGSQECRAAPHVDHEPWGMFEIHVRSAGSVAD